MLAVRAALLLSLCGVVSGGIAGFQGWFLTRFAGACTPINMAQYSNPGAMARAKADHRGAQKAGDAGIQLSCDHLCLDMNALLHNAVIDANDEEHMVRIIAKRVVGHQRLVRPRRSVVLALDGSAPMAKIFTQRQRRLASARRENMRKRTGADAKKRKKKGKGRASDSGLSTLQLTPGTTLMRRLGDEVLALAMRLCMHTRSPASRRVYVSNAEAPGEGEIKIIDWIRRAVLDPNDRIIVIAQDSDLLVQCLSLVSEYPNVQVLLPQPGAKGVLVSIKKFAELAKEMLLPPEQLAALAAEGGGSGRKGAPPTGDPSGVEADVAFLLLLQGNDYIPKMRGADFERLFECYRRVRARNPSMRLVDVERCTASADALCEILEDLEANMPALAAIKADALDQPPHPMTMLSNMGAQLEPPSRVEVEIEDVAAPPEELEGPEPQSGRATPKGRGFVCTISVGGETLRTGPFHEARAAKLEGARALLSRFPEWQERYDTALAIWEDASEGRRQRREAQDGKVMDPEAYLVGMLFTYQMYKDGRCPDFAYHYPFPLAPSPSELLEALRARRAAGEGSGEPLAAPSRGTNPLPPRLAAMAVLPANEAGCMPEGLSSLALEEDSPIRDMYDDASGLRFNVSRLLDAVERSAARELEGLPKEAYGSEATTVAGAAAGGRAVEYVSRDLWAVTQARGAALRFGARGETMVREGKGSAPFRSRCVQMYGEEMPAAGTIVGHWIENDLEGGKVAAPSEAAMDGKESPVEARDRRRATGRKFAYVHPDEIARYFLGAPRDAAAERAPWTLEL